MSGFDVEAFECELAVAVFGEGFPLDLSCLCGGVEDDCWVLGEADWGVVL